MTGYTDVIRTVETASTHLEESISVFGAVGYQFLADVLWLSGNYNHRLVAHQMWSSLLTVVDVLSGLYLWVSNRGNSDLKIQGTSGVFQPPDVLCTRVVSPFHIATTTLKPTDQLCSGRPPPGPHLRQTKVANYFHVASVTLSVIGQARPGAELTS